MNKLTIKALAATTIVAGTIAVIVLRWWGSRGHVAPSIPVVMIVLLWVLAAIVIFFGMRVRNRVKHHTLDDPIGAARVLVLSQAVALTAAIHLGYFLASAALAIEHIDAQAPRQQVVVGSVAALSALVLIAAGLVAQWMCRVPPPGEDDDENDPDDGGYGGTYPSDSTAP